MNWEIAEDRGLLTSVERCWHEPVGAAGLGDSSGKDRRPVTEAEPQQEGGRDNRE